MNKTLSIYIGEEKYQVFSRFLDINFQATVPHKHYYTEIYIFFNGSAELKVSGRNVLLKGGDVVAIPPHEFHTIYNIADNTKRLAFKITMPTDEFCIIQPAPEILTLFEKELLAFSKNGKGQLLAPYLSLICSQFPHCKLQSPQPVQDRYFLIDDFFSQHYYQDISLNDIASQLNVSEKQAARLIQKYMGNNFRTELTNRRLDVAKHLINDTEMNLQDISETIGFHSYSGFWKAFNKK